MGERIWDRGISLKPIHTGREGMVVLKGVSSYWLSQMSPQPLSALESLPVQKEVVVIGGGVIGVSIAYWLAKFGADVLLLEGHRLAYGASGRNAGFMLGDDAALNQVQVVLREEGIYADYDEPGHLALASSSAVLDQMHREVAERSTTALPVRVIARKDCEDLLAMRINERFLGGRWMPRAATIHPTRLVCGLAASAIRHGALLVEGIAALRIKRTHGGDAIEVETSQRRIRARHVVLSCNYWTCRFLRSLRKVLSPARGQMLSSRPLPPIFRIGLAVDWGSVYWRQSKDGVIVLGGYRGLDPEGETGGRAKLNPKIQSALSRFLPDAFPNFPTIAIARRWAGIMDQTPDGKPIVGKWPGHSNIWISAGFGGHGFPPALVMGKALAQAIVHGSQSTVPGSYDPARFAMARC